MIEELGFVLARPDDQGILHTDPRPGFGVDVFAVGPDSGVPVTP